MPQHAEAVRADEDRKTPDTRASAPATPAHKDSVRPRASAPGAPARHAWSSDRVVQLKRGNGPEAGAVAPNRTGLPDSLKAGIESLSGLAMDDVRVHRNSPAPARLGALAYTQGSDIHLGPGQERHLAHEAWHVVQQKQGRVRATTQMKGVGINDDAGLEGDADRFGAVAASGGDRPHTPARPQPSLTARVVQRRIIDSQGKYLEPAPGYSKVTLEYIGKRADYLLRQNSSPEDDVIHLLRSSKRYLLGERHDQTPWVEESTPWSVAKLYERHLYVPLPAGEESKGLAEEYAKEDQPIEDVNVRLLLYSTMLQPLIKKLNSAAFLKQPDASTLPAEREKYWLDLTNHISAISYVLGESQFSVRYADFAAKYEENLYRLPPSDYLDAVYKFSKNYKKRYDSIMTGLNAWVDTLLFDIVKASLGNPAAFTTVGTLQEQVEDIALMASYLPEISAELVPIVAKRRRRARLIARAAGDASGKAGNIQRRVLDAVNPLREKVMVASIKTVEPPLLVKIGDNHVDRVADGVGRSAVAIHMGTKLSEVTQRPGGKKLD